VIEGNVIGTDASGLKPLPNTGGGVFVGESAAGNTIGGTAPGAGNVIAANQGDGIDLEATNALLIAGNFLGTDITGTAALPNTGNGVTADGARNVTIGGTTAGAQNVISGNAGSGVVISGGGTYMDVVQGNLIGTDMTGTQNLGNGSRGIDIENTQGNTIGGTATGAANTIAYSAQDGVRVNGGIDNLISGNAIFANGGPGVDLLQGGNQAQLAPVLTFIPPRAAAVMGFWT
jgi:titin